MTIRPRATSWRTNSGRKLLAAGDRLHLGGDNAGPGLLDLGHAPIVAAFYPVSRFTLSPF